MSLFTSTPASAPAPQKRRWHWNAAGIFVAVAAVLGTLLLWANSQQFQNIVRGRVASELQAVTGGRVEIASFDWHVFRLEAQARDIVIHGDEGPGEAPYASVQRLRAVFSILGFWSPKLLLRDLEITRPRMHVIFYPDGTTNQPHPAAARKPSKSGLNTLFNLKAGHVAIVDGLVHLDNRAASLDFQDRYQPLNLTGNDLTLLMQYVPPEAGRPESYHIETGIRDFDLARGGTLSNTVPEVRGILQASLDLTRDVAFLRALNLTAHARGVPDHTLKITGAVMRFAEPRWRAAVNGELDMRLLNPVLGYPFAPEGIARLDLTAAGQDGTFRIDGSVHAQNAAYIGTGVVARGVDLSAQVHADARALRITQVAARLAQGGQIDGEVLLDHWLPPTGAPQMGPASPSQAQPSPGRRRFRLRLHAPAPVAKPAPPPPHSVLVKSPSVSIPVDGTVNANFRNVAVDTVLELVSQPPFQRLGLNALVNGPAHAVWTKGDVNSLSVAAQLGLTPSSQASPGMAPTTGTIDATYTQRDGAVDVRRLELNLPASHIDAHGRLGAYPLTSATALNVNFNTRNLGEFDTVLRDLGVAREGKSGAAALPIALGGEADFSGTWAGSLVSPQLAGNLHAHNLVAELPGSLHQAGTLQSIRWDTVEASGSYNAERIAIVHGLLQRGEAQISLEGTLSAPQPVPAGASSKRSSRGDELPGFDANSVIHAHIRAQKVAASDVLPFTGQKLPVTGTLDAQFTADGTFQALGGSGWAQLNDAVVYGEPVSSLRAEGSLANRVLKLTSFQLTEKAGTVRGSGSYDISSGRFQADARGAGIAVGRIQRISNLNDEVEGRLDFALSASGTRADPHVEGNATIADLAVQEQPLGTVKLAVHTSSGSLFFDAGTNIETADLAIHGHTELRGDYRTQAKVDFSRFNIAALFKLADVNSITAQSSLEGSGQIEGPLVRPAEMRGDLRVQQMAVVVAGVHLKSDGPVHVSLANARLALDPLHITGDDTDLRAQGGLGLRDTQRLDFAASGSVNLKLAETLDSDLMASGNSTFQIEAHGTLANPGLHGRVEFQNAAIALEDLPNGLSQLHGTLEFNQNRLEVKSLTAMTGGGQLSLGGYLAYQRGIYSDLTVTGKQIRIRYPQGVSSLADATLQLQGTQNNLLLSGNVLITRFSVSPDLDIAALANQANAVQPIAPPNAPSNHVRLDVHIRSSPQLNFQNAYAKLAGDVDLRLRGTVASPSLLGRISITEGNAVIAGTRYELQRGDVTFTNPVRIQPSIDLNATARVEDYDITLGLHGTPDKMSVNYRSDPPLPEADVVALLALGRTQSEQGLYTQQQQSAGMSPSTDVLLGGALNATVSSRVQKLFGAGSVKVDPSYLGALGNSTTRITVEEQFGRNVTLTYATNVDTSAQQLLQAEIAINRHVSVQVTRDESGVFSMVIKAIRRYR